jgi:hypothetical protein
MMGLRAMVALRPAMANIRRRHMCRMMTVRCGVPARRCAVLMTQCCADLVTDAREGA